MLYMIAAIVAVALLVLIVWQVLHLRAAYQAATGTRWQKFLAAFSDSATILLARFTSFGAAITAFVVNFLPVLDPQTSLGQALAAVLKPEYTPYYALGFGILFELVRRRGGSVDPIVAPKV